MKIKNKLALVYATLTLTLLTVLCVYVYYRFERFTEDDFIQRIRQRALVAARFHLDKDDVSSAIYENIIKEYLDNLPSEEEYVIQIEKGDFSTIYDTLQVPESFLSELNRDSTAYYMDGNQRSWVGIYYPDNQGDFVVLISAVDVWGIHKLDKLRNILVSGVLLSTMLLFFIGRWFAGLMLNPTSKMIKHVKSIRAHNLHLRVPEPGQNDELKELAVTFNEMLNTLEMTLNIHQNFINNASHELKTPLTSILGESEYALSKPRTANEYREVLTNISKAALRLEGLTYELLQLNHSYTKISPEFFDDFYLGDAVRELLTTDEKYKDQNICLCPTDNHRVVISANRQLVRIALKNLLNNALKFSDGNKIAVALSHTSNTVTVEVSDQGVGIPADELTYVTQPLYRGSNVKSSSGFGIGLSLTENIIKLHNGHLEIESEQEKGTRVAIVLPIKNSNEILISS
jgi:signal transduction histidine kinase